jgi:tetratricopeptide (TPR) repeat protein
MSGPDGLGGRVPEQRGGEGGRATPLGGGTARAIEELRAAAASRTEAGPDVRAALEAIGRLRPGEWSSEAAPSLRGLDADRLGGILDRVAAGRSRPAPARPGAVVDWSRELVDLLGEGRRALIAQAGGDPDEDPADFSLAAGEEVTRFLVERAGGSWDGLHYRNLYRAARHATGRERPWVAPGQPSGVVSADPTPTSAPDVDVSAHRVRGRLRGRTVLVDRLVDSVLHRGATTEVLVGPGGVGKSAVAVEVSYRVRAAGGAAFWVPGADLSTVVAGLEQVARRLEVPHGALLDAYAGALEAEEYALALWALLDSVPGPWLVVIDDVGRPGVGDEARVRAAGRSGTVLVTSRFGTVADWCGARVHELDELDEHDAAQVLQDRFALAVPGTDPVGLVEWGEKVVDRLGPLLPGLPLALITIGDLLAHSGPPDLAAWVRRIASTPWTDAVRAVYDLSLGALGVHRGAGRRLLRLMACFAPDELVPGSVLAGIAERAWAPGVDGIDELIRVGLLARAAPGARPGFRMHPAVAERSRADLASPREVATLDVRAVGLLESARVATDWGRPSDWSEVVALEPHVHELVGSPSFDEGEVSAGTGSQVLWLADRTSAALMRSGRHERATALLDRALARFAWLGAESPAVLASCHTRYWMVALDRGGDLPRARRGLEHLREACERVLGPVDPTTVKVLDTLGWVRAEQGELAAARTLLEEAISRRAARGEVSRYVCAARHRLAWVRVMMGEGRAAVVEFEQVLRERRELLGPDHLDVLSTRYRLAWSLSKIGEHDRAREQFALLLTQAEAAMGRDHPLALMVRTRVAWAALRAGDLEVAREVYTELLPEQEKVLGADHRRVLMNEHNLAVVTMRLGDPAGAAEELRSVVARSEDLLGPDHDKSLRSREMYAWALFRAGRAEEADRELVALRADRRRIVGDQHATTFDTRYRIARVVLHRGRLVDAESRLRVLVGGGRDRFGELDPRVLRSRHTLALAVGLRGGHDEAGQELRQVLAAQVMVLGSDQDETLATRDRLVWLQGLRGESEGLVEAATAVLEDRVRVLGPHHPHSLTSRYRVAWCLVRSGRLRGAARLYDDLVEDLRILRGPHHPHTLRARLGRLALRRTSGRLRDLVPEATDLVAQLTRHQGTLALATMRAEGELALVEAGLGWEEAAARRLAEVRSKQHRVIGRDHPDVGLLSRLVATLPGGPVGPPLASFPVR